MRGIRTRMTCLALALGLAAGAFIYFDLSKRGWSSVAE